jgi:hypothetical protein
MLHQIISKMTIHTDLPIITGYRHLSIVVHVGGSHSQYIYSSYRVFLGRFEIYRILGELEKIII